MKVNVKIDINDFSFLTLNAMFTHHEDYNEDKADAHNDEEWDQVIFQRQTEIWHENNMTTENKQGKRHINQWLGRKCRCSDGWIWHI